MLKKIITWSLIVIVILVAIVYNMERKPSQKDSKQYIVAVNSPLTGAGSDLFGKAPYAFQMGIEDELAKQNLPLDTFRVDIEDNQFNANTAMSIYKKQRAYGFDAYFVGSSPAASAIIAELNAISTPAFIFATEANHLKELKNNSIRILPNMLMETDLFIKFIETKKAKRVFYWAANLAAYHQQYEQYILPYCRANSLVCYVGYFNVDEKDFSAAAQRAKEIYKPDVVIVEAFGDTLKLALATAKEFNIAPDGIIVSPDYINIAQDQNIPATDKSGIYFLAPDFVIPSKVNDAGDFATKFTTKFATAPNYFDAYAYDSGVLLVKAYASKGKKLTAGNIIAQTPYDGVSGKVVVSKETRDLASSGYTIVQVNDKGTIAEAM